MSGWLREWRLSRQRDWSGDEAPEGLRALDSQLRSLTFEPRASLEPEIGGRIARGDRPRVFAPSANRLHRPAMAAAVALVCILGFGTYAANAAHAMPIVIDQCCQDYDGGGSSDDGVVITAGPGEKIVHLIVYEDRDESRSFTTGDIVRLDRGANVTMGGAGIGAVVTARHCCFDLDGGGFADDGLFVVGRPPDRVMLAGIYEVASQGRGEEIERPKDHLR